jgi:carboxymethylenebutenolidase
MSFRAPGRFRKGKRVNNGRGQAGVQLSQSWKRQKQKEIKMSEWVNLKAGDGHELQGYVATPEGEAIGALIVVQEIFGVNPSIQAVADSYAKSGFLAIAPALFDRFERGLQLGYEGEDRAKAFDLYGKLNPDTQLLDIAAAYEYLRASGKGIAVVGFCYGGLLAWLSATRGEELKMQPACCVGYYAGGIGKVAAEEPVCPVLLHFGADDSHIGADQLDAVRAAHPEVEICVYEGAGHAFANPDRVDYVAKAANLADARTLKFLQENVA